MKQLRFLVQGSATDPYVVTYEKDEDNLSAYCTCPAGANGQYCKHRKSILQGTTKGVVSNNVDDVQTAATWLEGTDVQAAWLELEHWEAEEKVVKAALSRAKRDFAAAMRD